MKKTILIITALVFIVAIFISLKSIDSSEENCIEVSGIVKSVSEGGVHDLVFELENDNITYYINRGLEKGFTLEKVKTDYLGKKVIINYAKSRTILAPFGSTSKHIVQITIDGVKIYSERK